MKRRYVTVDVFTDRPFSGNPLAVILDAQGLSARQMQAIACEFNLSETTFILPPENSANTARVRIFNRTAEMAFAGHPSIGTAYVIAHSGMAKGDELKLEVPAGIVAVQLERDTQSAVIGGKITAPQSLSLGPEISPDVIARCLGLDVSDVVTDTHAPLVASVGNPYVFVELRHDAIGRCVPDITAFREALASHNNGRFSIHVYIRDGVHVRARMFAPLAGTWEDPATGSANAPLAGLLLKHSTVDEAAFIVRQGEEMGRPSLLYVTARRSGDDIITTVAGRCVRVMEGVLNQLEP